MENKGKLANNIFFLSLLCIFVICSVLVVSYQIYGYKTIVNINDEVDAKHTPLSYLSNKVRANDIQNRIRIEHENNSDLLVIEANETRTYIYMYENKLMELQASKDYEMNFSDGDPLFEIDSLTITKEDHRLIIKVGVHNEIQTLVLTLHSEGGSL